MALPQHLSTAFDAVKLRQVAEQIQLWLQSLPIQTTMPVTFSLRRSARARKLRLQVSAGKVVVVVPAEPGLSILPFVQRHRQWLLHSLEKFKNNHTVSTLPAHVAPGQALSISFQGAVFPLAIQITQRKRIKIEFDQAFTVSVPVAFPPADYAIAIQAELIRWFKKQTQLKAEHWIRQHGPKYQLMPRSIVIRRQKSRWGSCGIHNDISLNWLLILAPPEILEYVVVHELCHIRIKNHSQQFWQLVGAHLPNYRQSRCWLRENGSALLAAW
jgi:predicted metal-dependent hydrolase